MDFAEFLIIFMVVALGSVWTSAWAEKDVKFKNRWVVPGMVTVGVVVVSLVLYVFVNR